MAKRKKGVRSPHKNLSLKKLRQLEQDHFYNPETGLELAEDETRTRINEILETRSERQLKKHIAKLNKAAKRKKNWIPKDEVIFRTIKGRRVPFRKKKSEPWL